MAMMEAGAAHHARLLRFKHLLNTEPSIRDVRTLCFDGIPDEEGLRALYWRVLFGYLPPNTSQWAATLARQRAEYYQLVSEFVVRKPAPSADDHVLTASLARVQPLSSGSGSSWELFFRDNDLIVEIDRDVRRTMPSMALFQQPSGAPNALLAGHDYGKVLAERLEFSRKRSAYQNQRQTTGAFEPSPDGSELHWEVIRRMLFVYAKVNPGIRYVQGMNDLLAIIYYVMVQHASSEWKEWAEPDTFWCFVVLMGERQDMFLKSLDNSAVGVKAQLAAFDGLLKRIDFQLWISLNGKGLDPSFYAFRWMTLLMSHEFEVPDTIRLWDSLLADPNRFEFLSYFCIAMMEHLRDHLLRNDFGECLSTLQNYPLYEISGILAEAVALRQRDREGSFDGGPGH